MHGIIRGPKMLQAKTVKVSNVIIKSEKTGEVLTGTVIDAGRIQAKVNG